MVLTEYKPEKSVASVKVPDGVTRIGVGTFWGCKKIQEIMLPNSVTQIDPLAFAGCKNCRMTIPDSVKKIGWRAVYRAENCAAEL